MNSIIKTEINNRRKNLLSLFRTKPCFIISKPENMYYYSGFRGDSGYLLYNNRWFLLTDSRYTTDAIDTVIDCEVIEINKNLSYEKALKKIFSNTLTIYYEGNHLLSNNLFNLKHKLNNIFFVDGSEVLSRPRRIKSSYEIKQISYAEEIGSKAYNHILKFIKEGVSEIDIACELEYYMKKCGATKTSFDTIVASGKNGAKPHAIVSNKVFNNGDFITMDFGCIYNNYCSDMTRTVAVGEVSKEMENVYNIVLEAQEFALKSIKSGVLGKDIDKIAREYIIASGYGEYFGHGLGHSLGLEIHENPNFNTVNMDYIDENMILSVEPGIYLPNRFGVRIEDIVLITKSGYKNLTSAPKKLYHC